MVSVIDCDIVVSKFEVQSRYYVYFRTNAHGKGLNPLVPLDIGLIVLFVSFKKDFFVLNNPRKLIYH